eukprot:scaffold3549_cov110-Skeletonema_dohrnii-CCMP3373.AAC.8
MKIKLGGGSVDDSRRFTLSDWEGAVEEPLSGDVSVPRPVVRRGTDDFTDNHNEESPPPQSADDSSSTRATTRRRSSVGSAMKGSIFRRISFIGSLDGTAETADPQSGSESGTDFTSSTGSNIWSKLMSHNESLWDGVDGKGAFDDDDDDESVFNDDGKNGDCRKSMKRCGLTWWWETQHFFSTMMRYPHILVISLVTFGVLCGVGIAAIIAEKENYIAKQKSTAQFVARETANWFSDEFRRAMLPLYSVQQGVLHSGYFDSLPEKIGRFPNLVIPGTEETDFTVRNVTGICDDRDMINKFRSIVRPINQDNDLDGIVVGYRLFPNNVACLTEPHAQESSDGFNADDFPQGEALLSSDNAFGLDTGSSAFPLWKMITTDLFINRQFNIFGPFNMPPMSELICGHLAIWKDVDSTDVVQDTLNVHGTEVAGAWGFIVNFLDWTKMKDKSDIYKRFADCHLEFDLTRVSGSTVGLDSATLAKSENADMLTDENSIVVTTTSLHGEWQNKVGSLNGWEPAWFPGAVAGIVLASFVLAFLTASTLVERQLHRNLLYKVMPRRAIMKLQRGQTVLEKFNLVTIFFSDIVGFTNMAGNMRPIQVMKMLNELYTELDKLVEKHNVYKVETIGDAYMVVGGAPSRVPAPLAAERVALFALEAVNFVRKFRTKDGNQIFIRAGLASGPTVGGVVGCSMPRYCFFGDTVNFASRMESTSKKMKIQVADITYRLLQDAPTASFVMTKRVEGDIVGVQVKGKGHQVTHWIERAGPRAWDSFVNDEEDVKRDADSAAEERNYTSEEIYDAMTSQDWESLGHASSSLVAATDDGYSLGFRACALLEHHLLRVLQERDPSAEMSLSVKIQLNQFVQEVSETYGTAKFHNWSHANHVTTSMNKLLAIIQEGGEEPIPLNSFSLVFAALVHDAGHTGMSNKILKDIDHPLSKKFDDSIPIAEKNSIDIALDILFRDNFSSLRNAILPGEMDKIEFARTLFQSILITDIATPDRVKLGIERFKASQDSQDPDVGLCPLASHISDLFDGVGLDESVKDEHPDEFVVTSSGLKRCVRNEHLMLLSDVGHLCQSWENFIKWNFRLFKELMDCHRKKLCDNPRETWVQGQIAFFDKYIIPLAERCHTFFPDEFGDAIITNAMNNLKLWTMFGIQATNIMALGVRNDEREDAVLMELYGLGSDYLARKGGK